SVSLCAAALSNLSCLSPSTLLLLAVTYHTPPNLTSLTTLHPHTHTNYYHPSQPSTHTQTPPSSSSSFLAILILSQFFICLHLLVS
ncbi:hypothetical protein BDQ94DRAFT_144688, partial [Aspergillus welwitschiae]